MMRARGPAATAAASNMHSVPLPAAASYTVHSSQPSSSREAAGGADCEVPGAAADCEVPALRGTNIGSIAKQRGPVYLLFVCVVC